MSATQIQTAESGSGGTEPCRGRPGYGRAAGALACWAVLLGGCGAGSTLAPGPVERAAEASILSQRHLRVTVQCPAGIPLRTGFTFWCTARLEVGAYPLLVTETNAAGHVRYENRAPLLALDIARVQQAIRTAILERRHTVAPVHCPQQVIQRVAVTFFCHATLGGHTYRVEVIERDNAGDVRYVGLA